MNTHFNISPDQALTLIADIRKTRSTVPVAWVLDLAPRLENKADNIFNLTVDGVTVGGVKMVMRQGELHPAFFMTIEFQMPPMVKVPTKTAA